MSQEPHSDAPLAATDGKQNRLRAGSLGPVGLAIFVVSAVGPVAALIGASPFIFMSVGPGATFAYVIALAVFLLISVGYVAMAKRLPHAGGFVNFIAAAFDRRLGAAAAMLAIMSYVALLASIYAVFGVFTQQALQSFFDVDVPWVVILVISAAFIVIFSINRIDINAKIIATILLIEIGLLLWLVIAILTQGGAEGLSLGVAFDPTPLIGGQLAVGLLWALGSFLGFEATAVFSEEAKEPRKTVPRATFLAVTFMGVFFILLTWAVTLGYGAGEIQNASLEDPAGFIYALGTKYIGPLWADIMNVAVLVSFTLILIGFHNIVCRYVFALGRAGFLPRGLGRTHHRTQAPHWASVTVGIACLVLLLILWAIGGDPYGQIYPWLYALGAVGMYFILFSVCVSVPVYFRRNEPTAPMLSTRAAPVLSAATIVAALIIIFTNYDQLIGPDAPALIAWSPILVPIAVITGYFMGRGKTAEQLNFTVTNLEK